MKALLRRAWVWVFGPGDFGGAFFWTLFLIVGAFTACAVVCAGVVMLIRWAL